MNTISRDALCGKTGGEVMHEGGWSANIEIRLMWESELLQQSRVQVPWRVEIYAGPIVGIGCTVAYICVAVGQRVEQLAHLVRKRPCAAIPGTV